MLNLENVNAYYGESYILQNLSLEVKENEIVCLLGRNGVGKSTTMKTIMGFVLPRSGRITFLNDDTTGKPPFFMARKGMSYVPEDRQIFPNLTVLDNLKLGMSSLGRKVGMDWKKQRLDWVVTYFPRLKERAKQSAETLSGGEQQMLAIARGLVANPKLMLLDEPSQGLAPAIVKSIFEIVKEVRKEGVTILLAEQSIRIALEVADRAYLVEKGQIIFEGPTHTLLSKPEVRERLGIEEVISL
ncbi:MAG: ABC transporter ATP-binding protein [Candidatus Tectomicrobia bacterium]|uniref:ABC transporter ATP-binding protein n=1 Tax=Tectimicrobiota bacterium TaxID=2528274 RepID=A0A933GM33_UNCTE|nr:ABC transporter ATP-binding protein [Candidatus Tectomicrobia bacterium]